jgi:hypothetical protein
MPGSIWWAQDVRDGKERRARRRKTLLAGGGVFLLLVLAAGVTAHLTNPSFDDFTAWHEKRVHEAYEGKKFYPSTAAEKRKVYGMFVERKDYIFFSLYRSKTEVLPLEQAVCPYFATHPTFRKNVFIKPSEYLPKGWKSETLYTGLFGMIIE